MLEILNVLLIALVWSTVAHRSAAAGRRRNDQRNIFFFPPRAQPKEHMFLLRILAQKVILYRFVMFCSVEFCFFAPLTVRVAASKSRHFDPVTYFFPPRAEPKEHMFLFCILAQKIIFYRFDMFCSVEFWFFAPFTERSHGVEISTCAQAAAGRVGHRIDRIRRIHLIVWYILSRAIWIYKNIGVLSTALASKKNNHFIIRKPFISSTLVWRTTESSMMRRSAARHSIWTLLVVKELRQQTSQRACR